MRLQICYSLLTSVHINAARDEDAWQNNIIDKDRGPIEYRGEVVPSTKEDGIKLMRLLEALGPRVFGNMAYGMASVAHAARQAASFTGRSLLDACIEGQNKLSRQYASGYAEARVRALTQSLEDSGAVQWGSH